MYKLLLRIHVLLLWYRFIRSWMNVGKHETGQLDTTESSEKNLSKACTCFWRQGKDMCEINLKIIFAYSEIEKEKHDLQK